MIALAAFTCAISLTMPWVFTTMCCLSGSVLLPTGDRQRADIGLKWRANRDAVYLEGYLQPILPETQTVAGAWKTGDSVNAVTSTSQIKIRFRYSEAAVQVCVCACGLCSAVEGSIAMHADGYADVSLHRSSRHTDACSRRCST